MNFRFAHYDPPKADKKRPRKAANPKKVSTSKAASRTSKTQDPKKQQPEPEWTAQTRPLVNIAVANTSSQHRPNAQAIERDSSSPETVTSGSSSSSDHDAATLATSLVTTPSTYVESQQAPSLVTILGEGRIDPFHIYPVEYVSPYVQMLLDHALTYKWPHISPMPKTTPGQFRPLGTSTHEPHPVKQAWLQCALNNPVAFYALVYASSQHLAWLHGGQDDASSRAALLRLSYKTEAVKLINQALRELNGKQIPDPLIIAILSLGAHGNEQKHSRPKPATTKETPSTSGIKNSTSQTPTSPSPRHNPLATAQMLHFYGRMDQEAAHMSALRTLVAHNNGIDSIRLPGLAGALELGDLLNSTITHRRPCIPPPQPLTPSVRAYLQDTSSLPLKPASLPPGRQSHQLLEALAACRAVTAALAAFVSQAPCTVTTTSNPPSSPGPTTLADLTISRNAAHHSVLALSPANGLWGPEFALYESLRLATLIFSDLVLFPVPRETGVRGRYARLLKGALECCTVHRVWVAQAQALGWCAFVGALAVGEEEERGEEGKEAEGEEMRAWFVGKLRTCFNLMGLAGWEGVRVVLGRWLWWEWFLGDEGRRLWEVKTQAADGQEGTGKHAGSKVEFRCVV